MHMKELSEIHLDADAIGGHDDKVILSEEPPGPEGQGDRQLPKI
jgi:hypothetical protein